LRRQELIRSGDRGLVFVVSAPAGTGKTTLVEMLTREFSQIIQSISFTSRNIRGNEKQGIHYNFVSPQEFEEKIAQGDFLEYAKIYGNFYGTSKSWVEQQRNQGKHVVLVIDTQGAMQVRKLIDAVFVFVMPPSLATLEARLIKRKTETMGAITTRLALASEEIKVGSKEYDYLIVNQDLEVAYQILKSIFVAESHRISGCLQSK